MANVVLRDRTVRAWPKGKRVHTLPLGLAAPYLAEHVASYPAVGEGHVFRPPVTARSTRPYLSTAQLRADWSHARKGCRDHRPAPAPDSARPTIRKGSTGQLVRELQQVPNRWYPKLSKLAEDGIVGKLTEDRVKHAQRRGGITVDGVVGAVTWGLLGFR